MSIESKFYFLRDKCPRGQLLGSVNSCVFSFIRNCQRVFYEAVPLCIPTSNVWGIQFPFIFTSIWVLSRFLILAALTDVQWYCGFNLDFPDEWWYRTSFQEMICHLYIIFDEISVWVFCLFSGWIVGFFTVEFWDFLACLHIANIFSQSSACPSSLFTWAFADWKFCILMRSNLSNSPFIKGSCFQCWV